MPVLLCRWLPGATLVALLIATAVALVPSTTAASYPLERPNVTATAEDVSMVINEGRATATFRIRISNGEESKLTALSVVYADNNSVFVGDIEPGGSAVTGAETRSVEIRIPESKHHPLPITLKFAIDGDEKSVPASLILRAE